MSWTEIKKFLGKISKELGYELDNLSFEAELRTGGPTIKPRAPEKKFIERVVVAGPRTTLPSGDYDTLGSKHIEYRVVHTVGTGKVKIQKVLYTWQLHPFPGNCGICVHRWVQILDDTKSWSEDLQQEALRFRAFLAREFSYGVLLISTGNSFSGAELVDEFETIYVGKGRGDITIRALNLREFLKK